MKVEVTDISPVRKSMFVEVAPEDVQRETDSVLQDYRKKAKIRGFRTGKAPLEVVRGHYGPALKEEVRDRLVSRTFHRATEEKGLKPLGNPSLEDLCFEDGKPMTFKTVFEVLPAIELKGYKDVDVTRPSFKVTDEDLRAALEEIRHARVQLVAEEGRVSEKGDIVYVDVEGAPEGGEAIKSERMPIEVGAEKNLEEFNRKLLGVKAGTEMEFSVDYPKDYSTANLAGKRVDYRMAVQEVKKPVLPDLDDEFAKDLGDFDSLAALEAKLRDDLEVRKKHEAEMATRQAVLDKVLIENPVVLPEMLVDQEIRRRLEEFVRSLLMQGIEPDKAKIDWEALRRQQEEPARKAVHARLILDAVAEAESIGANDSDVDARIEEDAKRLGEAPEKLRSQLHKHSSKEAFVNQLVREKSLDYLTAVANIHYAD